MTKTKKIAFNFNLLRFFKRIFNWVNFQFENLNIYHWTAL